MALKSCFLTDKTLFQGLKESDFIFIKFFKMKNQTNEWLKKITNLSKNVANELTFWFLAPIAMVLAVVIPKTLGLGTSVSITTLIAVMVLYMILRTDYVRTKRFDEYEENFRHTLTLSVFFFFIFSYLEQVAPRNPWGAMGWIIALTTYSIVVILLLLKNKKGLKRFSVYNWGLVAVAPIFVIGCIAEIYLHWAMWWVWVPIGAIFFFAFTSIYSNLDEFCKEDLKPILILLGIGVVSIIWQFWTLETFWSLKLWELLCWVVGVIVVILFLIFLYATLEKQNEERRERELYEKNKTENEKQAMENLNKAMQMKEDLQNSPKSGMIMSQEIIEFLKFVYKFHLSNRVCLKPQVLVELKIIDLIEVSEVKKQIRFENDAVLVAFYHFNSLVKDCFDDEILNSLREQLLKLEILEDYKGYDVLVNLRDKNNFQHILKLLQG